MTCREIFMTLCLAICLSAIYGKSGSRPNYRATSVRPGCQPGSEMQCMEPLMAYIMTPEGQQLAELGRIDGNFSQIFTENVFHRLCRVGLEFEANPCRYGTWAWPNDDAVREATYMSIMLTQTVCYADYMSKCAGPELQTHLQFLTQTSTELLAVCNETDAYSTFITVVRCGERIKNPARLCFETAGNATADANRLSNTGPSVDFFKNQSSQKDMCCFLKRFQECVAPSLKSTCTSEEKTVTQKAKDRIVGVLGCTDAMYQAC